MKLSVLFRVINIESIVRIESIFTILVGVHFYDPATITLRTCSPGRGLTGRHRLIL